jgi:hypothetical protein
MITSLPSWLKNLNLKRKPSLSRSRRKNPHMIFQRFSSILHLSLLINRNRRSFLLNQTNKSLQMISQHLFLILCMWSSMGQKRYGKIERTPQKILTGLIKMQKADHNQIKTQNPLFHRIEWLYLLKFKGNLEGLRLRNKKKPVLDKKSNQKLLTTHLTLSQSLKKPKVSRTLRDLNKR